MASNGLKHVLNFTHDFIYTDGEPYVRVEIEEVDMACVTIGRQGDC